MANNDELTTSLLKILMPSAVIINVDAIRGINVYSNVTVRLLHNGIQFNTADHRIFVSYGDVYSVTTESSDSVQLRIYQYSVQQQKKCIQDIIIDTDQCPFLVNSAQYRTNVFRIWTRRLQSGIVKTALRFPETLAQLNSNRTLFGQISFDTLNQLSACVKEFGFTRSKLRTQQCEGAFEGSPSLEYEMILSSWRVAWGFLQQQCEIQNDSRSETSISMISRRQSKVMSSQLQSITGTLTAENEAKLWYERQHEMAGWMKDAVLQREKLKQLTGQTEQMRVKTIVDTYLLKTKKIYNKFLQVKSNFKPMDKKHASFEDMGEKLKKEINLLKNTLIQEFRGQIERFQVVKELAIEGVESLDPVQIEDIVSISVEEVVFSSLFEPVYQRAKRDCQDDDHVLQIKCDYLNEQPQSIYDFVQVPEKLRDPCEFALAVEELKQIENAANFHPRHFLNCILETMFAIQLTVRFSTPFGLECKNPSDLQLAADDLVPLFIFVFVKARLQHPATIQKICDGLMDERIRNDEYGNCLINFSVCLEWLKKLKE